MQLKLLAAAAVSLALGGSAHASALFIDFAATPTGTVSYTGAKLGQAVTIDFGANLWNVSQIAAGDQSGLTTSDSISISPTSINLVSDSSATWTGSLTKTWEVGSDFWSETFTSATITRGTNTIDLEFSGLLTPPTGPSQTAFLDISFTQAGGPNHLISGTATNSSFNPAPGPVPGAGYAGLAALALAGLYARARRA